MDRNIDTSISNMVAGAIIGVLGTLAVQRYREHRAKKEPRSGSLVSMGMTLGAGVGLALGAGIGVALGNIAIGAGMGVALGAAIGMTFGMMKKD